MLLPDSWHRIHGPSSALHGESLIGWFPGTGAKGRRGLPGQNRPFVLPFGYAMSGSDCARGSVGRGRALCLQGRMGGRFRRPFSCPRAPGIRFLST
eukprot:3361334-Rhodomonas_salina.5